MARRGSNEGSIYKRADGRWAAVVNLGWQDGKRRRKTFYAKTRREVKDQLTKALSDHQKALPVTSDRLTTGQFLKAGWWTPLRLLSGLERSNPTRSWYGSTSAPALAASPWPS